MKTASKLTPKAKKMSALGRDSVAQSQGDPQEQAEGRPPDTRTLCRKLELPQHMTRWNLDMGGGGHHWQPKVVLPRAGRAAAISSNSGRGKTLLYISVKTCDYLKITFFRNDLIKSIEISWSFTYIQKQNSISCCLFGIITSEVAFVSFRCQMKKFLIINNHIIRFLVLSIYLS